MVVDERAFLTVVGGLVFFLLVWCLVLLLIAWLGGWRRLSKRFGQGRLFYGDIIRFACGQVGLSNYSGVLKVGASDTGLYLVPIGLFRPFHPPLLIPWTEMEAVEEGVGRLQRVQLRFPALPRASIVLYGRAVACMGPYLLDASQQVDVGHVS
jgi:hypothetical protein